MTRDLNVAQKCEELKAELQNKKTLVDVLLQWIGRRRPASVLVGIIFYFFLPFLIGFVLAVLLGEFDR